ncbi:MULTISPECIES: metallophosphoesterase [Bradyrhizobium]|uniref:metallophosphoesterase n=1 Tax=Bradyrhizobium TaxID=374 RepID=UPI000484F537|nr:MULTISPECIES: metallophosphoesterase [Bradyrhizobium]MCS3445933.1 putative phosphodiesterase [Bradyrhizobium elkanii]MCS3562935.1 putative phosphodiesterase [Bradyrhizobium elkanii]MCW2147229.1 putative phosphodiesterase [Bradyrhizobium elkanii]MCW2353693.1 putative phosphodiesterase [Bradyrhizobium elkanii]MCW2380060.1 putative phosphodiesterase [Bradyrhizobium elkanii]
MRLWILSDLHLELTRGWDLPSGDARPDFDVMVVAGDLIPRMERGVKWLLERVPDQPVIYVAGNHEAYGTDIDRTLEKAKAAAAGTNVHVLENGCVRIGVEPRDVRHHEHSVDVTFAGCTLWTDFGINGDAHRAMTVAAERMNDFKKIRMSAYRQRFLPHHALTRHFKSIAFLKAEMRRPREGKLVVISHHGPIPAPRGSGEDPALDPAFRSDLRRLMSPAPDDGRGALRPADLWIYGHTHESFDAVIGETTRVVSNAKGYGPWPGQMPAWDNADFDPNFVIEI